MATGWWSATAHHNEREVITAAGPVPVRAPRVNGKRIDPATGERKRFASAILPAWARKSPRVGEVLPLLYLRGLSSLGLRPGVDQFLGHQPRPVGGHDHEVDQGLAGRGRHVQQPAADRDSTTSTVGRRDPPQGSAGEDKVCLLVMIGVRADGTKELSRSTTDTGNRPSRGLDLLRGCKRRGMAAPVLAVGDGALGFWKAVRDVFPDTREQRCWWHKIGNVLNALPKSAHPGARKALAEIWNAEDREHAQAAARRLPLSTGPSGPRWPRRSPTTSTCCWPSATTPPSTGSTCAPPTRSSPPSPPSAPPAVTKGPGSRAAGVAMAFKLIQSAQTRWRAVNAPHLVALVRAGAVFKNGVLIERPDESEGGD